MDYPIVIMRLSDEDGGGFLATVPDLVGCASDGQTRAEAVANVESAIEEWIATAKTRGMKIPAPGSTGQRVAAEFDAALKAARQAFENVEELDGRLDALERAISEIQERLENDQSWDRFSTIVGLAKPLTDDRRRPT